MLQNRSFIQRQADDMLVQYILFDKPIYKIALSLNELKNDVSQYFNNHWDPNDKTGSFLNAIAPGALSVAIGGWLGPLLGLGLRLFNIDIAGALRSIYEEIKSLLKGTGSLTVQQIDGAVDNALSGTDPQLKQSFIFDYENAQLIKEALLNNNLKISIAASSGKSIISKVLSFVIRTLAMSAGLMVTADVANKMLGRPNAFDATSNKSGIPQDNNPTVSRAPLSSQTTFPLNQSYSNTEYNISTPWIEKVNNTQSGIENMLVSFAKDVYQGLNGLEAQIKQTPHFQALVQSLLWYNHMTPGDPLVFIPKMFKTKREVVDHFINDVVKLSSQKPQTSTALPTLTKV